MTKLGLPFDDETSPEASSPGYLNVAEAAERVRCHEQTIRRAIDRGALRAGRVRGANAARARSGSVQPIWTAAVLGR
jgi:excisionase family DNA binding protein